jgi:hypothetical protein
VTEKRLRFIDGVSLKRKTGHCYGEQASTSQRRSALSTAFRRRTAMVIAGSLLCH